ncbi:uncharacterized protein LOC130458325 [Monodelphis domestica]|uniref:uncharacterized protein LOC130458325 n=1 Tax=Monodelphis domestica TaxID=13616 RepID=UPI0004432F35|nr:uncharacterized protein LOC130458325 [Monodelphis domestica]
MERGDHTPFGRRPLLRSSRVPRERKKSAHSPPEAAAEPNLGGPFGDEAAPPAAALTVRSPAGGRRYRCGRRRRCCCRLREPGPRLMKWAPCGESSEAVRQEIKIKKNGKEEKGSAGWQRRQCLPPLGMTAHQSPLPFSSLSSRPPTLSLKSGTNDSHRRPLPLLLQPPPPPPPPQQLQQGHPPRAPAPRRLNWPRGRPGSPPPKPSPAPQPLAPQSMPSIAAAAAAAAAVSPGRDPGASPCTAGKLCLPWDVPSLMALHYLCL